MLILFQRRFHKMLFTPDEKMLRRLTFGILLSLSCETLALRAQEIIMPAKTGSVRFAAIGDMGTGDPPQYEVAQTMLKFHEKFAFNFAIMLGDNI